MTVPSSHRHPVAGVVPVLATTFDEDDRVDRAAFRRFAEHVASTGVDGVMFPGFASEYYKLGRVEVDDLLGDVLDVCAPACQVVASVAEHATRAATERVRELADRGVSAINVLPPHFLAPAREAVLEHLHQVLGAAAGLAVVLQYAPGEAGVSLSPTDVAGLRRAHANLAAVKVEARPPGGWLEALRHEDESLPCLAGTGGLYLLEALRQGAVGVQPGGGFVELYLQIWRCWTGGEVAAARSLYLELLEYLVLWAGHQETMVAVDKLVAHRRGLVPTAACRAPHRRLQPAETAAVERFLEQFGDRLAAVEKSG